MYGDEASAGDPEESNTFATRVSWYGRKLWYHSGGAGGHSLLPALVAAYSEQRSEGPI